MAFYRIQVQELLHLQIFGNDKETTEEAQQGKQSLWTGCDQGIELYPGDASQCLLFTGYESLHGTEEQGSLLVFTWPRAWINVSNEYSSNNLTNII